MNPKVDNMNEREALRLEALRSITALDAQAKDAIERLASLARSLLDTPIALVSLVDDQRLRFIASIGLNASEAARDQAFCAHLVQMGPGAVIVVEDAAADPRFAQGALVTAAPNARFYAGAALTTKDGHVLGALCVIDDKPRPHPDQGALERLALLARIVVDELELARASRAARERQRLLDIAETMSGVGHWRLDLTTRTLAWSDTVYAIHGVTRANFDPSVDNALAFYAPDDRRAALAHLETAIKTGTGFDFRLKQTRADGALRHVVCRGVCELDDQGHTAAIVGLFQDITETVETIETLKRSKHQYRLVTEHAGDVITLFDFDGVGQFNSPAVTAVLGYAVEEMAGATAVSFVHPDDRNMMLEALASMSQGLDHQNMRHRVRHKLGHYVWMESNLQLVRDADGAPTGIVSIARDISDRKAMEAVLEQARADAEAAAAVKSEFLSNMSHELRTPLTAVLGFSRLIEEQPELSPVTRRFVDRVQNAGEALMSTINDILDFSKLEAGQVEIDIAPCDPRQLFADALDLFSCQAREKGIALEIAGLDGLPPMLALARDRVRQVLLNLIGNAVKFTDQGRVALKVAWNPADERLRLEVLDTGPGIPADRQGHLFKRFSQVDGSSTRRHGGTGLGLAICKGLVEAMGGQIGVSSQSGRGSVFWFELPAPVRAVTSIALPEAGPLSLLDRRVLVVDDNPVNRDLARTVLQALGVEVTEASNGEESVRLSDREPFDIILMDLHMPGMGGQAAAEQIRRGRLNGNVPIVAFSANATQASRECFDGVVLKPLAPAALVEQLNRVLRSLEVDHAA